MVPILFPGRNDPNYGTYRSYYNYPGTIHQSYISITDLNGSVRGQTFTWTELTEFSGICMHGQASVC